MAEQQDKLIDDLSDKVEQLKTLYLETKRQRDELKEKLDHQTIALGNANLEIQNLTLKCTALSAMKTTENMTVAEAKSRRSQLLELVREIDKCIVLLNK